MNPPSKPFLIDKRQVYEAYLEVRSKEGAGGVDGVTIEQFEKDLKGNLYKDLESNEFGRVLPAACARGDHSEEEWRPENPWCSDRRLTAWRRRLSSR